MCLLDIAVLMLAWKSSIHLTTCIMKCYVNKILFHKLYLACVYHTRVGLRHDKIYAFWKLLKSPQPWNISMWMDIKMTA